MNPFHSNNTTGASPRTALVDRETQALSTGGLDAGAGSGSMSALISLLPELKLMVGLVTGGVIIAALYFGRDVLIPITLAVLLSFLLAPLVDRLRHIHVPRVASVMLAVIVSLGMLILVLLHSGKGGGLSDMFGGGMGASAQGSTVMEKNLDRLTVVMAIVFAFTTVALGMLLSN